MEQENCCRACFRGHSGIHKRTALYHEKEMAEYHIVTDQVVTLAFGLVLPDALFEEIIAIKNTESTYWNAVLKEEVFAKTV